MKEHVDALEGSPHTLTERCGPAPFNGKPRRVLPPPEKNNSLTGRYEVRDQQVGEGGLTIVIAQRNSFCCGLIQKPFYLETEIPNPRCEDGIFGIALAREGKA